jgi:hypothetical protein
MVRISPGDFVGYAASIASTWRMNALIGITPTWS